MRKIALLILWLCGCMGMLPAKGQGEADYARADSMAGLFPGHSLDHPALLAHKLTQGLEGDKERFRALYRWVCTNITNDYGLYLRNRRKQVKWQSEPEKLAEWQRKFAPLVFKRLRKHHATLCTGYAYILRELARHVGLEAELINGYGRTANSNVDGEALVNHSWNAIRLDGVWYLCDPTWSSGYIREGGVVSAYDDDVYFLVEPELFILNHYPEDVGWTLLNEPPALEDFLSGPLSYKPACEFGFKPERDKMRQQVAKGTPWKVGFEVAPGLEGAVGLRIADRDMQPIIQKRKGGFILSHSFGSKGHYDVHITVKGRIVATYSVEVVSASGI
ncbi:transglutaminase domain-containing protein [Roseivirga sp. BDSF3-8]|uniref:transglutaminase domain-containing protein n=1 Tax=Roseivirga sp. BDSF3-8 TaxID=3241598 RepID=UPI0035321FB1